MKIDGIKGIDCLIDKQKPILSFDESRDFNKWKNELNKKFIELSGIDVIKENLCDPEFEIEKVEQKDGYKQIRFVFMVEEGEAVPCYLLIPDTGKEKYPVVITLQGHTSGFHLSIGEIKYERDKESQPRNSKGIQAVRAGYIALCIEQRGMGERAGENTPQRRISLSSKEHISCYYQQMTNMLMGRTLLGGRCVDVSRAIDMLSHFPECDLNKIAITGGSGGGTASYYAAAYDQRIKLCVPVIAFCPYKESILRFYHCSCNYIPGAYRYFDMQDIAALIAPRRLVIINGKEDPSFLIEGATHGYKTVEKIYDAAKSKDNCQFIVTDKGHYWCEDIVWDAITKVTKAMDRIND